MVCSTSLKRFLKFFPLSFIVPGRMRLMTESLSDELTEQRIGEMLRVAIGLETFSLLCCLLVPLSFLAAWKYSPELCKRVTFQLSILLALVEALYICAQLFSNFYVTPGFFCGFGTFVYAFSALLSITLSTCIAVNLQVCLWPHFLCT